MKQLKEWREEHRVTQKQLANKLREMIADPECKIEQSTVSAWESGHIPNAKVGEAIRRLTKGKVNFLDGGRE